MVRYLSAWMCRRVDQPSVGHKQVRCRYFHLESSTCCVKFTTYTREKMRDEYKRAMPTLYLFAAQPGKTFMLCSRWKHSTSRAFLWRLRGQDNLVNQASVDLRSSSYDKSDKMCNIQFLRKMDRRNRRGRNWLIGELLVKLIQFRNSRHRRPLCT